MDLSKYVPSPHPRGLQPGEKLVGCCVCGNYHPQSFNGDCRDPQMSFPAPDNPEDEAPFFDQDDSRKPPDPNRITPFVRAYIRAALWSSVDHRGRPLDENYGLQDIEPATLNRMVSDCELFQEEQRDILAGLTPEREQQIAHDFWLDRNGHGAGAQDGHWPDEVGERLAMAAAAYGEFSLVVDDDGMLYFS